MNRKECLERTEAVTRMVKMSERAYQEARSICREAYPTRWERLVKWLKGGK